MTDFIEPMLAQPADKPIERYDTAEWAAEVKYDGHRLGIRVQDGNVSAWSRLAKPRLLAPHLVAQLEALPNVYLDGEIIIPGGHSWDVAAGDNSGREQLVLFDVLEVLGESLASLPYTARRQYLGAATENLEGPAVWVADNGDPTKGQYDTIVSEGGEGMMLKRRDSKYRPGQRSFDWLKVKARLDATLTIIGFESGTRAGLNTVALLRDDEGHETKVKVVNEAWVRRATASPDAYIGKQLEIEFQVRTPEGSYRHPMWKRIVGEA